MENKIQKKPNDNSKENENKRYDVFISYRHSSSDSEKYSTPLARTISQEFESEKLTVFFDGKETNVSGWEDIKKSGHIIILVTSHSLESIKKYPYKTINKNENRPNGYNFAKELCEIEERLNDNKIKGENIFLLNIDNKLETSVIQHTLTENNYEQLGSKIEIVPLLTEKVFRYSMRYLIDRINGDDTISGFNKYKKDTRHYKIISRLLIGIALIAAVLGIFLLSDLGSCNKKLQQYENKCIIFAGGGTVQRYLSDSNNYGVDVSNYPISKYVHLPSKAARTLLWDDVNSEDGNQTYTPVVLSTGELDSEEIINNINSTFKKNRRIVKYKVGESPLIVQITNWQGGNTITPDRLRTLINDTTNYILYTTTPFTSGTYNAYEKCLDTDTFRLSEKKSYDFNRKNNPDPNSKNDNKKEKIFLSNGCYYRDNNTLKNTITLVQSQYGQDSTIMVPINIYIVAKQVGDSDTFRIESKQVKEFLQKLRCDTTAIIKDLNNTDKIVYDGNNR